ncbi:MAG: AMP-binding protein [Leptospiraceae bacterium]|nr:AMP-binding protein [Leptospiraceae bacterium]
MQNLVEVFARSARLYPEQKFYTKDSHKFFKPAKFSMLHERAQALAAYLIQQGVKPGDRVAIFAENSVEWLISDMAIQMAGAIVVPRGADSTAQELGFILEHAEAKLCFVEHLRLYKKIRDVLRKRQIPTIVLDPDFPKKLAQEENLTLLPQLLHDLPPINDAEEKTLDTICHRISPQDLFTIIYTSGTTGEPKGVMLSHANMLYQLQVAPAVLQMSPHDRILSILPVWHIFERFMLYCALYSGCHYYYSNKKDLMEDFIRAKPTLMASAPRLWEQIYQKLRERIDKTEAFNRELFDLSYSIKQRLNRAKNALAGLDDSKSGQNPLAQFVHKALSLVSLGALAAPDLYMDAIFLVRVRAMLGGELRGTISGGGALPLHIDEFFNAIGIPVYEGYGMTETAPLIAMRRPGKVILGTVGFPPEGTQVEIRDEETGKTLPPGERGVIFVKGPGVMQGYYKNPEATAKVLQDGWINTGDLGYFTPSGALKICGRAKDTIVLLSGENLEPVPIETLLVQHPLIEQAVVVGQDQKNLGVLIWPDYDRLNDAGFAVSEFNPEDDLNRHPELIAIFKQICHELINEKNGFKSFERIAHVRFLPQKLRVGEELTALMKIKRNVVQQKYAALIAEMFRE